jgi:hypothetical protein
MGFFLTYIFSTKFKNPKNSIGELYSKVSTKIYFRFVSKTNDIPQKFIWFSVRKMSLIVSAILIMIYLIQGKIKMQ